MKDNTIAKQACEAFVDNVGEDIVDASALMSPKVATVLTTCALSAAIVPIAILGSVTDVAILTLSLPFKFSGKVARKIAARREEKRAVKEAATPEPSPFVSEVATMDFSSLKKQETSLEVDLGPNPI